MTRKKRNEAAEAATISAPQTEATEAVLNTPTSSTNGSDVDTNNQMPAPPSDGTGKNYGPPYKAVFTSADKGFELGEDRRFKQRVFSFKDKPNEQVIAALKQHGFTYRPAEKAWTVEATAESRVLTDRLAKQFAGSEVSAGRG